MADNVQRALRRKYAAAQAIGDLERMKVLRGFLTAPDVVPTEEPVEAPAEPPVEPVTVPEVVPEKWWRPDPDPDVTDDPVDIGHVQTDNTNGGE